MKKLSLILAFCLLFGMISGCDSTPTELKETEQYVLDCGATLTAGAGMDEKEMDGFTAVLQGKQVMIFLLDENKSLVGTGDLTVEEYAQLVQNANGFDKGFSVDANGNLTAEYTRENNGTMFYYYATIHESGSSFWLCQMACEEQYADEYVEHFSAWSASLELKDTELKLPDIVEKTYTLDSGLQFTGPDGMRAGQMEGFDAFWTDNLIGMAFLSEEKPDGWTLEDYAEAVATANAFAPLTKNEKGALFTEYTWDNPDGGSYWYYVTVAETEENFWLCQFFGMDSVKDLYAPYLPAWSASVKSVS